MQAEKKIENLKPEGTLRSNDEKEAASEYVRLFEESPESTQEKLHAFPKFIRRQEATRFLSCYEIFKKIVNVKGSIVECGVFRGFGLMSWALFSSVLQPANLTRRIYGFDTFSGFHDVSEKDKNNFREPRKGDLSFNSFDQLNSLIGAYDKNRFLGHINKVNLIKGNAGDSIPKFVNDNPHLVVSLLF